MTILDLDEALLLHILGLLTLQERQRAALVSKRFRELCCSPELLQEVETPYVRSLAALQSFLPWLARHGQHFAQLPRLQRLRLQECRYLDESLGRLSALSGSLTRLDTVDANPSLALPALTRLQHLSCRFQDWELRTTEDMGSALQHLTGLTCLVLNDLHLGPLVPALSGLSRLRLRHLRNGGLVGDGAAHASPLPGGPWLCSLQWLSAEISTLLSSAVVLQGAAALECVSITDSFWAADIDWRSPAADAFFDWLAQHPPLRRLSVDARFAVKVFLSQGFLVHIVQLCRRRPALLVQCPGLGDEGESFLDHLDKTQAF